MITATAVRQAFRRFSAGERPQTYGPPKTWYVIDDASGRLYPLKAIWALANDNKTRGIHTHRARAELSSMGFKVVRSVTVRDGKSFDAAVSASIADDTTARRKRLASAPKKPLFYYEPVLIYVRNPDVVAEALFQAKGTCGSCGAKAPFERRSDKTPYLEVHHVKPLAEGGYDSLDNVIALCPNCHRKAHFG